MPRLVFDPAKNAANRRKHGLALTEAERFDWDRAAFEIDRDTRHEQRLRVIGRIGARLFFLVCEFLGEDDDGEEVVRVISLRPCDKREARRYEDEA